MGLQQQKSRQSKFVVIMHSDILISDTAKLLCSLFLVPQQLEEYMSTLILPLFHF